MLQQDSRILWNHEAGDAIYKLGLRCDGFEASAQPGQFVMLHLKAQHPVLLRRPFSIHRLLPDQAAWPQAADPQNRQVPKAGTEAGIEIIYKVVGPTTARLAACQPGEQLNLVGPLGRGFDIPPAAQRVVLAGGGMGIAPLYFLVQHLQRHFPLVAISLFLGGRRAVDLVALHEFQALHLPLQVTTDDGSLGQQCLITHPLEQLLADAPAPDLICACGPMPMLACLADLSTRHGIACQISIETMMACGMGACLGCACASSAGSHYLHACMDGPVMAAGDLDFSRWAT